MIQCNQNSPHFTISDEKPMKTSDIINPLDLCKGNSSNSNTSQLQNSINQSSSQNPQLQLQKSQEKGGDDVSNKFRRPRNKSFAKVLNKRQQIRDKFKNDFFQGKNIPLKSPQKSPQKSPIQIKKNNLLCMPKVDEEKNISQHSLDSEAQIQSTNQLTSEKKNKNDVFQFTEEDIQPIFLRVNSNTNQSDIENDKKNSIFHIHDNNEITSFESVYEMQNVLGEGCVGLVKKAIKISDQKEFAVKIVRTRDEETIMNIKNEFLHLKQLHHKNIVKVYEIYIDKIKGKIYTVMELIKGREMFEVINQLGSYSEQIAKKIFKQIVEAINYMHNKYVCHRDLKPNNILCDEIQRNNSIKQYNIHIYLIILFINNFLNILLLLAGENVKITDFNVSKFCDSYKDYSNSNLPFQGIKMWTYTGTIAFSAPELFSESSYDENIDIWSAGVILYTMLCGKEPFQAEFVQDLIQLIIEGKYSFPSDPWDKISQEAKDLINRCLTVDPENRIKPDVMLQHPWLLDNEEQKEELDRNQLGENIIRLVKGRSTSVEKQNRRRRSKTLQMQIQLRNNFNSSQYIMFSNKCFDNPKHSDEENSDDQEDDPSPMRGISMTVQERPKEQNSWLDKNSLNKHNQQLNKQNDFINKLEEKLQKKQKPITFMNTNIDINVFDDRKVSQDMLNNDILSNKNKNAEECNIKENDQKKDN